MKDDTEGKFTVTINEKILLHLKDFSSFKQEKEVPRAVTQRGIAVVVGILPSHVPRALKKLISDGLLYERDGYIEGGMRKSRVYFLTDQGTDITRHLAERISAMPVNIKKDGKLQKITLCEVNIHLKNKLTLLQLYNHQSHFSCFDVQKLESGQKVVEFVTSAPSVGVFINREKDSELLKSLAGERRVVVIFGVKGVGKTALTSRYMESFRGKRSIFWYQLDLSDTLPDILESLSEFLQLMGIKSLSEMLKGGKVNAAECLGTVLDALNESGTLMVFDGYNEPAEDITEFFYMLVNMLQETTGITVLITARDNIPFYQWFYSRKEVDHGIVGEVRLKGLDHDSSKKILAVRGIEDHAYKQIFQLTKGVPQLLEYVRDNNSDALKGTGLFTAQEIRLMLGLKNVVKK